MYENFLKIWKESITCKLKNETWLFIKTNKLVFLFFLIAILGLTYKKNFSYNLSIAYLSSLIFYVLVVYIPKRIDQINISAYVLTLNSKLLNSGRSITDELFGNAGYSNKNDLSLEDFNAIFKKINPKNPANISIPIYNNGQCFMKDLLLAERFDYLLNEVNDYINKIRTYMLFLDSEYIQYLNQILNCNIFTYQKFIFKNIRMFNQSYFPSWSKDFYNFYITIDNLEKYSKNILTQEHKTLN